MSVCVWKVSAWILPLNVSAHLDENENENENDDDDGDGDDDDDDDNDAADMNRWYWRFMPDVELCSDITHVPQDQDARSTIHDPRSQRHRNLETCRSGSLVSPASKRKKNLG